MELHYEYYTWDKLNEMQDKAYHHACTSDLYFVRRSIKLFDGWILIASGELINSTYILFLSKEQFANLEEGEIEYLQHYYTLD